MGMIGKPLGPGIILPDKESEELPNIPSNPAPVEKPVEVPA